jgi:hypothetical protein
MIFLSVELLDLQKTILYRFYHFIWDTDGFIIKTLPVLYQ